MEDKKLSIKNGKYCITISIKKENDNEVLYFYVDEESESSFYNFSNSFTLSELKECPSFQNMQNLKMGLDIISTLKNRINFIPPKQGEKSYIFFSLPGNNKKFELKQEQKAESMNFFYSEIKKLKEKVESQEKEIINLKNELKEIKDELEKKDKVDYKLEFLDIPAEIDINENDIENEKFSVVMKIKNLSALEIKNAEKIYFHAKIGNNNLGGKWSVPSPELNGLKPGEEKEITKEFSFDEIPEETDFKIEIGYRYSGDKEDKINTNDFSSTVNINRGE